MTDPNTEALKCLESLRDRILYRAGINPNLLSTKVDTVQAIISPIAALDVAYGIWEDLKSRPWTKECKVLSKRLDRCWKELFGINGKFYHNSTENEQYWFCEYADRITEKTKSQRELLRFNIQKNYFDMVFEDSNICTDLMLIDAYSRIAQFSLEIDLNKTFVELQHIGSTANALASAYRKQVLGPKATRVVFDNSDEVFTSIKNLFESISTTSASTLFTEDSPTFKSLYN